MWQAADADADEAICWSIYPNYLVRTAQPAQQTGIKGLEQSNQVWGLALARAK